MTLRFIHAADLHIDSPFKGLTHLPPSIRKRVTQSTFHAFHNLITLCLQEKVDFLLIAGDVYDAAERSLNAQLSFKTGLERLAQAGIHTYIVHGNHDPLDGYRVPIEWPDKVHFFPGNQVELFPFYKDEEQVASIYGFSYPTAQVTENVTSWFQESLRGESDSGIFSIGLLHTNCGGFHGHERYAPCSKNDLIRAGFDYWALGHVHTATIVHEHPAIAYPGNIQGRHSRETGEKGCYLVEVDQDRRVTFTFRPVQDVLWMKQELDITGIDHFQGILDALDKMRQEMKRKYSQPVFLHVNIVGQTPFSEELAKQEVLGDLAQEWQAKEEQERNFVWLSALQFLGSMNYDRAELRESEGFFADLLSAVDQWVDDPESRQQVLEHSLADLFTHHRARKYLDPLTEEEQVEMINKAEIEVLSGMLGGRNK